MKMNKKSQQHNTFGNAHPLMILGIIIFVMPFLGPAIHIDIPGWIGVAGVVLILVGAGLSILKVST